ncbi:hypothetical protein VTO42DRAFT_7158 [Malbranchea cinnamomea]
MSALEIEEELSHHSLVSQAVVVGVPHHVYGAQIAALVVMDEDAHEAQDHTNRLNLVEIRRWLAVDRDVAVSKLPTTLRIVGATVTLPTTPSKKSRKKEIRDRFFNQDEVNSGRVDVCDLLDEIPDREAKPFDWWETQSKAFLTISDSQCPSVAAGINSNGSQSTVHTEMRHLSTLPSTFRVLGRPSKNQQAHETDPGIVAF